MAEVSASERKAWAREAFRGFENVLVPSFTPDLTALDEVGIRHDVRRSIEHGFFSTLCATDAGLSLEEQRRFLEVVADEAQGRLLVSFPLVYDSFEQAMTMLQHAERVGCTHALMSYPLLFDPRTEADVERATRLLAEATNLGIVLFASETVGFPRLHPSTVPFELYGRLLDIPNVVALMLTLTEPGLIYECFERYSQRVLVASSTFGLLPLLVATYGQQWSGAWPVEALQSPDQPYAVELFDLLRQGKHEQAMPLYWKLTPARGVLAQQMAQTVPVGGQAWSRVKFFQYCVGGNGGQPRFPSTVLYQRDMRAIRSAYRAIGIPVPDEPDTAFFLGRANAAAGRTLPDAMAATG